MSILNKPILKFEQDTRSPEQIEQHIHHLIHEFIREYGITPNAIFINHDDYYKLVRLRNVFMQMAHRTTADFFEKEASDLEKAIETIETYMGFEIVRVSQKTSVGLKKS